MCSLFTATKGNHITLNVCLWYSMFHVNKLKKNCDICFFFVETKRSFFLHVIVPEQINAIAILSISNLKVYNVFHIFFFLLFYRVNIMISHRNHKFLFSFFFLLNIRFVCIHLNTKTWANNNKQTPMVFSFSFLSFAHYIVIWLSNTLPFFYSFFLFDFLH